MVLEPFSSRLTGRGEDQEWIASYKALSWFLTLWGKKIKTVLQFWYIFKRSSAKKLIQVRALFLFFFNKKKRGNKYINKII